MECRVCFRKSHCFHLTCVSQEQKNAKPLASSRWVFWGDPRTRWSWKGVSWLLCSFVALVVALESQTARFFWYSTGKWVGSSQVPVASTTRFQAFPTVLPSSGTSLRALWRQAGSRWLGCEACSGALESFPCKCLLRFVLSLNRSEKRLMYTWWLTTKRFL